MPRLSQIMTAHPQGPDEQVAQPLIACVRASLEAAAACTACADACLSAESTTDLRYCIRVNHNCADLCFTLARVLLRNTAPDVKTQASYVAACKDLCRTCATECENHRDNEACRVCAEVCRDCERACQDLLEIY